MPLRDLLARVRITTQGAEGARRDLAGIGDEARQAGDEGSASFTRFGGVLDSIRTKAGAAVASIAAIGVAFVKAGLEGARFAQDLNLTASAFGLTVGRARELERALNLSGQDLSDLRGIVAGLRSAVGEAVRGNENYAESLRGIGLEVSSLAGLDTEGLLMAISQAILDLGDISSQDFSLISALLGDDDAARIIAAAGDIKAGLLAELRVSDDEIADALNVARFRSNAENIGQDIQLGLAAGLGNQDSLGEWRRQQLDLGRLFRENQENETIESFANLTEFVEQWGDRAGGVWAALADAADGSLTIQGQRTRVRVAEMQRHFDQFGTSAGGVWARLTDEAEAYMRRLVLATEEAVREANARLRSISLTTPTFDTSPAGLRGIGLDPDPTEVANEQNFLDIVRGFNRQSAFESATGVPGAAAPDPEDDDLYGEGAVL